MLALLVVSGQRFRWVKHVAVGGVGHPGRPGTAAYWPGQRRSQHRCEGGPHCWSNGAQREAETGEQRRDTEEVNLEIIKNGDREENTWNYSDVVEQFARDALWISLHEHICSLVFFIFHEIHQTLTRFSKTWVHCVWVCVCLCTFCAHLCVMWYLSV